MNSTFLNNFLDDQPDLPEEQPILPRLKIQRYIQSVLNDLEKVLNSKMNVDFYHHAAFDTLLSFGVVDFSSINVSSKENLEQLKSILLKTIRINEPRLSHLKVSLKESSVTRTQIAFKIEAVLAMPEGTELVMFSASFASTAKRFKVIG